MSPANLPAIGQVVWFRRPSSPDPGQARGRYLAALANAGGQHRHRGELPGGANAKPAGIGEIFYGDYLTTMFNAPGVPDNPGPCCFKLPGGDPRTPDIIVAPNVGVVYTGSSSKQSEHGG